MVTKTNSVYSLELLGGTWYLAHTTIDNGHLSVTVTAWQRRVYEQDATMITSPLTQEVS